MPATRKSLAQLRDDTFLAESLGFAPQLLIDDLTDLANNAISKACEAFEEYLYTKWLPGKPDECHDAVEKGLLKFQTLLQNHLDLAFDGLEKWSLNNVFRVEDELEIVMPHHIGLDLEVTPEEELELNREIAETKMRIHALRVQNSRTSLAIRIASRRRERVEIQLKKLEFLKASLPVEHLPDELKTLLERVSSLPPLPPPIPDRPDPGKKLWESSYSGYLNWAVQKTIKNTTQAGDTDVRMLDVEAEIAAIGSMRDMEGIKRTAGPSNQAS